MPEFWKVGRDLLRASLTLLLVAEARTVSAFFKASAGSSKR